MSVAAAQLPATVRVIERDWLSSNNVLLFDDEQATLIDTGYGKHVEMTCQLVAAGLRESPTGKTARLARIINTHLHSDHCGGNAALAAQHQCSISVPQMCIPSVKEWTSQARAHGNLGQQCDRFYSTDGIAPGDNFRAGGLDWTAHAAPGHDPTSLIFFNPDHRILISADALWEHGFGVIFPEIFDESGFAEQAAVLQLIEQLNPTVVIPGHGPVFADVLAALARAKKRIDGYIQSPKRSHQNALKVIVKFLLLDRERLRLEEMHQIARTTEIFVVLTEQLNFASPEESVNWAISELSARHQLAKDGAYLINANGPGR